jgi:hypothetical protein
MELPFFLQSPGDAGRFIFTLHGIYRYWIIMAPATRWKERIITGGTEKFKSNEKCEEFWCYGYDVKKTVVEYKFFMLANLRWHLRIYLKFLFL